MKSTKIYPGIDKHSYGAMNPTANIIRDAWVFGIIPESETCAGWTLQRLNNLYDNVHKAWRPYGHMVSNLPEELRARHARIYSAAISTARAQGWSPSLGDDD